MNEGAEKRNIQKKNLLSASTGRRGHINKPRKNRQRSTRNLKSNEEEPRQDNERK